MFAPVRLSKKQLRDLQQAQDQRQRERQQRKRQRSVQQSRRVKTEVEDAIALALAELDLTGMTREERRAARREVRQRLRNEAQEARRAERRAARRAEREAVEANLEGLSREERRAARRAAREAAEAAREEERAARRAERQAARAAEEAERQAVRAARREERQAARAAAEAARQAERAARQAAREAAREAEQEASQEQQLADADVSDTEATGPNQTAFQQAMAAAAALPTREERRAARQAARAERAERRARREERRARREERRAQREAERAGQLDGQVDVVADLTGTVESELDDAESVLDEMESDVEGVVEGVVEDDDAKEKKKEPPVPSFPIPGVDDDKDDDKDDKPPKPLGKPKPPGPTKIVPKTFRDIPRRRRRVMRRVVRPEYQRTRDINRIARDVRQRNPGRITPQMELQIQELSRQRLQTGRTFFPPQNANPTVIRPYVARFQPPRRPLPTYMNWADSRNVAVVRGWGVSRPTRLARAVRIQTDTQGYMHEVVDQLGCGSCWVISVASAMSDRVAIWGQEPNPQLSVTNILGCVSDNPGRAQYSVEDAAVYSPATAGCAGGLPTGAIELFAELGDTTQQCAGYEWCVNDPICNKTRSVPATQMNTYLNGIIPSCAVMQETCISADVPQTRWGLKTYESGRPYILLTDPDAIKQEIAANGPVVATHAIYSDFEDGTAAVIGDGWAPTRGVYCNVQRRGPKPYDGTTYANGEGFMLGYHAVVIVGWGVETDVPDWTSPGSTLDIPYWIVRNSWGPQWNPTNTVNGISMPGYCKIAITDYDRDINTKVYLDNADDDLVGAAVAFMPEVQRVNPPQVAPPQINPKPQFEEERLEDQDIISASDATSFIAGIVSTGLLQDLSAESRDIVNHPIFCLTNTPYVPAAANCVPSRPQRFFAKQKLAAEQKLTGKKQCWMVVGLLVIVVLLIVVIVLCRRRR